MGVFSFNEFVVLCVVGFVDMVMFVSWCCGLVLVVEVDKY